MTWPTNSTILFAVMELLRITFENAKLKGIWHYSLPSGHSCPGAKNCYTKADRITGKITDLQTPDADGVIYRCYAAMDEARRPNVRAVRWDNFDLLKARKSTKEKVTLIVSSIRNSGLARGGRCVSISAAIIIRKAISTLGCKQPSFFQTLPSTPILKASRFCWSISRPTVGCQRTLFLPVPVVENMTI